MKGNRDAKVLLPVYGSDAVFQAALYLVVGTLRLGQQLLRNDRLFEEFFELATVASRLVLGVEGEEDRSREQLVLYARLKPFPRSLIGRHQSDSTRLHALHDSFLGSAATNQR